MSGSGNCFHCCLGGKIRFSCENEFSNRKGEKEIHRIRVNRNEKFLLFIYTKRFFCLNIIRRNSNYSIERSTSFPYPNFPITSKFSAISCPLTIVFTGHPFNFIPS